MAEYKDNLLGEANSFLEVLEQVSHLAPLDKPVLIIGERGTGKELIASRLHYLSSRWQGPFISLNCAALNENLLDSELFGHEAGAFTGAQKRHPGRFERADGGTLFLDELATAPMMVQEKLLRVIEYGELERVGGSQPLQVNVRLVCATNADLPAMVNEGTFRADLLDRLAFDVVQLPPLRERESDIMLMAEHFAIQMCREIKLPLFPGFTEHARETLLNYRWPGNIRELKKWWNVQCIVTAPAIIRLMTSLLIPLNAVHLKKPSPFQKTPRFRRCHWIYASFRCSRKKSCCNSVCNRGNITRSAPLNCWG